MPKFNKILFWCEFPSEVDWEKLNDKLKRENLKIKIYVAASFATEYYAWRKIINKFSNIKVEGAWPILPLNKGYWFSGFTEKKYIDHLDNFKGENIKIDIEPPFPYNKSIVLWLLKHIIKRGKNSLYLQRKIKSLTKRNKIIVSSFPLPKFLLRRMGAYLGKEVETNYMFYTTFIPRILRHLYKIYYKWIIKNNPNSYFALGLLDVGIFRNETTYKTEKEFEDDIKFLLKHNIKNIVIFRAGALVSFKNWIKVIKKYS